MRSALLVSTYEMGRQPFGLASAAAWLRAEGLKVTCVDAAREKLADRVLGAADLIAFHLPMHTATRLAAPVIVNARRLNPSARIWISSAFTCRCTPPRAWPRPSSPQPGG